MSILGLWEISLILTGVSLLVMLGLIGARLFSERRARAASDRRATLIPRLLSGDVDLEDAAFRNDPQTPELLLDLIAMVRGDDRERFVALAYDLGIPDRLVRQLKKGVARTRVTAAEALAYFSDQKVTDALDRALEDPNRDVRLTAALSLADSGRAPPIRFLVERLSLGRKENSLLLVTLLQRLVEERAEEIEGLLGDDDIPEVVKAAAIEAFAASGSFHLAPAINRLAVSADPENEETARYLRALGVLRHPAGAPAVLHHLRASTWWVRAAAAEAAGRIAITQAVPVLVELLSDPEWWVRFRAGEALAELGKPGLVALRQATTALAEPGRSAARLTLAELGLAPAIAQGTDNG